MKVLLIYPRYTTESSSLARIIKDKIPPLGLAYVAAALEEAGHLVKIIDAEAEEKDLPEIKRDILEFNPFLIGISTTTIAFHRARETAAYIKKEFPGLPIVIGGPHLASFPKLTLNFDVFDYGVVGEGEITIQELVKVLEERKDLAQIKGIVYRQNNEIFQNEPRPLIENLDTISLPAWHLLPLGKYREVLSAGDRYATMISSRGCPFNCLYCDPIGRFGKRFRARSPENLVKEIEILVSRYKIEEICFYDDTFTLDKERIFHFCDLLIEKNLKILWECRTRVDCVNEELLKKMKQAGCYRIRFGVEAGDQKILNVLKKHITLNQVKSVFQSAKRIGIETFAYFMIGSPKEDEQTIQKTINFALEIKANFALFSPTLVQNYNCELFKWAAQRGYIAPDYWQRWVRGEKLSAFPVLETEKLTKEKIYNLTREAYRRFYFRPTFIWQILPKLRDFRKVKIYFLLGLQIFSKRFIG